jgi:hypothetical protein
VGENVVGDDQPARLDLRPRASEVLLVVGLFRVDEDDVEDILDRRDKLERVPLEELDPFAQAGRGDVLPPERSRRRVVLDRKDAPTEIANSGPEPDARIAARPADLQDLT